MTTYVPPKKNTAWIGYVALPDALNPGRLRPNPTLASGDVKVSIDGGAFANLATLPTVTPASGSGVKVSLSTSEMNGDNILVVFKDQTDPPEWADMAFCLQTAARQIDDLAYPATSGRSLVVDASGQVTTGAIANNAITAAAIATDAIDNDAIAANAVTEIQSGLATASALSTVDSNVSAIKAKTDNLPSDPADASDIAGAFSALQSHGDGAWATGAVPTVPTADENASALLDGADAIEGGITVRRALRGLAAMLLGTSDGGQTGTERFRAAGGTRDRVIMTDDAQGNRSVVMLDLT